MLVITNIYCLLKSFIKGAISGILSLAIIGGGIFALSVYIYRQIAPLPEIFAYPILPESSKIYARDGQLLYEIYREIKRSPVELKNIALPLQQAMVAIEDKDFYHHPGISVSGMVRSYIYDTAAGQMVYGGSTISQQVVKNILGLKQKTLARKLSEVVWAVSLERNFSKEKILELYLNSIPFGRNTYGVEAAAISYFGKSADKLDVAESAYLAAIPKAPAFYNPDNPERRPLEERKNLILAELYRQNYINSRQFLDAKDKKVKFLPSVGPLMAPHFVMWVKQELIKKYGEYAVYNNGLKVYTTLDVGLQGMAEQAVRTFAQTNLEKYHAGNAGLVAIDPKTGQILAMVGGKDYFGSSEPANCKLANCLFDPNTNVALAPRQPGSSFKPYVYATAFSPKFSFNTGSIILDVGKNFSQHGSQPYTPQNYNGRQYGRVTLRKALAGSLNIATVRLASQIGTDNIIQTAHALGIKNNFTNCGLALALGSCEVSLLEHTDAFSAFANSGVYNPYASILKVTDKFGQELEEFSDQSRQAVNLEANYELVSILSDAKARTFIFGKNPPLTLPDRPVIAKTGTTQDWKDGWTVGGTEDLVAGVWVGNNNGETMAKGADGVFVAAPIWQNFIKAVNANFKPKQFVRPSGIADVETNPYTGKLALPGQSHSAEVSSNYAMPQATPVINQIVVVDEALPIPPEVFATAKIVEPKNGQVVPEVGLVVKATAEQGYGTRVSLFIDSQFVQSSKSPDFSWQVPQNLLKPGAHTISILATNQAGYRSQDSISLTVSADHLSFER